MFISERETRDLHDIERQQATAQMTARKNDSAQVTRCLKMQEGGVGLDAEGKIDLASLSVA